jgi:hypothetical protein
MTRKKSVKKRIFMPKRDLILWSAILVLVVLQALSIMYIIQQREYAKSDSNFQMRTLLKEAEEERYKYPVIDVAENRVYIPEVRIYLPLNEVSRDIRYEYRERGAGFWLKALYLSTSSVVGQQSNAQYASCDKMIILAPSAEIQRGNMKVTGSIEPTKDGLTDIYVNSDDACWDQNWYTDQKQGLSEVVKQAKNY